MKKKWIFIIIAVLLGLVGAGLYLYISSGSRQKTPEVTVPTETPKARLIAWDDPAGFTFSYPEGPVIDKHDEDKVNYAHIEFSHPQHPGGLIIWAKDLPAGVSDTATWVKKDATLSAAVALDTSLGEVPAKKLLMTSPAKRLVVGTVYDGLVFYVDTMLTDDVYWQAVADAIVESFVFKPIASADAPVSSAGDFGGQGDVDEEEVLE